MTETNRDLSHDAFTLWIRMQPSIKKVITKVLGYNHSYDFEDYLNEAYVACVEALTKYRNGNHSETKGMKEEVFAFWFIEKRIHKMADTGEIAWIMYDPHGKYVDTVPNGEYRRIKKDKEGRGYTFVSRRMTLNINDNFTNNDKEEIDLPDPESITPEVRKRMRGRL